MNVAPLIRLAVVAHVATLLLSACSVDLGKLRARASDGSVDRPQSNRDSAASSGEAGGVDADEADAADARADGGDTEDVSTVVEVGNDQTGANALDEGESNDSPTRDTPTGDDGPGLDGNGTADVVTVTGGSGGQGGAIGTGGTTGMGGAASTGGATATGGAGGTGAATGAGGETSSGGASGTGGAISTGGTAGATGGGGSMETGETKGTGGSSTEDGGSADALVGVDGRPGCSAYPNAQAFPSGNVHCYWFNSSYLTWADAEKACAAVNGHLVAIQSSAENSFVLQLANSSTSSVWLGGADDKSGTDTSGPGTYHWSSGDPWSYQNWVTNQPDCHCVGCPGASTCRCDHRMVMGSAGTWSDWWEGNLLESICEAIP